MKIIELSLLTDNLVQTEIFYSNVMDFRIISKNNSSISFAAGLTQLTFKQSKNENPIYHFAFNIPNNKIEESLNFISNKVEMIKVSENNNIVNFEDWNAKSIYFKDNNGNILELIARLDLDNKSSKFFNSMCE